MPKIEECYPFNLVVLRSVSGNLEIAVQNLNIWQVQKAITLLSDKEQKVLELRYDGHKTLDEVGSMIGVTRERVRQIEAKALRKFRKFLRDGYCEMVPKLDLILANRKIQALEEQIKILSATEDELVSEGETSISLDYLDLSVRTYNCMRRACLDTLDDIIRFDRTQNTKTPIEMEETNYYYSCWSGIRNFGLMSYKELKRKVYELSGYTINDARFERVMQ